MMSNKSMIFVVLALFLVGCNNTKIVKEYVPVTKVEYVSHPMDAFVRCPIPVPPDKQLYLESTVEKRNLLWLRSYQHNVEQAVKRNMGLDKSRELNRLMLDKNKQL